MRKILFFSLSLLCLQFTANAQITKGSLYFGGSVGYSQNKEEASAPTANNENKSFTIAPAVGLAVKENLIAGIDLTYSKYKNLNYAPGNTMTNDRVLGAGAFMRRYFPIAKKFYAFGQARFGYFDRQATITTVSGTGRSNTEGWGLEAAIYPGITYNVGKAFFLEMGFNNLLHITYAKEERTVTPNIGNSSTFKQSHFSVGSSLSNGNYLNVGVRFIVPRK